MAIIHQTHARSTEHGDDTEPEESGAAVSCSKTYVTIYIRMQ